MSTIGKKISKKGGASRTRKLAKQTAKKKKQTKRKQAIEKAIVFWDKMAVDMSNFKFDREEANAR